MRTSSISVLFSSLLLVLNMSCMPVEAQEQALVESKAYALMLDELLSHSVPEISIDSLSQHMQDFSILDAREQVEYEVSHIVQAVWVGYDNYDSTVVTGLDKDQPIAVYCSVGYRSEKIAERLIEAGYTQVFNLYGGLFEWKNQQHAVFDTEGETERVHAYSLTWGIWLEEGEKVFGSE